MGSLVQSGTCTIYGQDKILLTSKTIPFCSFSEGKRDRFKLDLLKLKVDRMEKVGEWTPAEGLNVTDKYAFMQGELKNAQNISMHHESRHF